MIYNSIIKSQTYRLRLMEEDKMQRILLVIDMQNDFISGSLGTPEAVSIVSKVVEKIRDYKAKNDLVIYTRDTHFENYLDTQEGKNLPVVHCVKATWGWELEDQIKALVTDEDPIYDKETFGSLALGEALREIMNREEDLVIEMVGLCTDICVVSNAMIIKANCPEVKMIVDATCCAGVTPQSHQAALETMRMCQISIIE